MKKIIGLCVVGLVAMFLVAPVAFAAYLTIDDTQLFSWDNLKGSHMVAKYDVPGPGVEYHFLFSEYGSWADEQVGDNFPLVNTYNTMFTPFNVSSGLGDLSGYSEYSLTFFNTSITDYFMANLYMNTGWTDSPTSEPDYYWANSWTWLAPGETKTLTLDFSNANYWWGGANTVDSILGSSGTGGSIINLNHVSNIGFGIGTNVAGSGSYAGDNFTVKVSPVPEPATMLLLGSGLLGLAGFRRKRRRV